MQEFIDPWKARIAGGLNLALQEAGIAGEGEIEAARIIAEIPPKPELGDIGFPLFAFAKLFKKAPPKIAEDLVRILRENPPEEDSGLQNDRIIAQGPYLNVFLSREMGAEKVLQGIFRKEDAQNRGSLSGIKIMLEFSSPNTNKPLHLGHLRNDILGESLSRILAACGAEVRKVSIINNRGIHICKSMLAYKEAGEGKTPESEGVKGDHFVGDWYVKFHAMSAQDPAAEDRARELLIKWEAGDPEIVALWRLMNSWTIEGMNETYRRTGISFDKYYYESDTYLLGKDEVLKGLAQGIFYRDEDGAVMADLTAENLDKKVLLRKDGTSIYITQDFGTAIHRREDWPFDRMIYVVGSEQQYHFQVLFTLLKKLGYPWAKDLHHLSYGMVNLPDGKMKSREGTVVDADDLLDSLRDLALEEIRGKDREEAVGDPMDVAEKVALGALHYYLLAVTPQKDMLFNPKESLSFTGNTGPYLQYMGARISALLRKAREQGIDTENPGNFAALKGEGEWEILKMLASRREKVEEAAAKMDPSILATYLYELSKAFSRFYHDSPILNAEPRELAEARLSLSRGALEVLKEGLYLLGIPFLETM